MGMYTELVMACEIKKSTPTYITVVLAGMCDGDDISPEIIPEHPLFKTERWSSMLTTDSAYFSGDTHSECTWDEFSEKYGLTIRCNLKNYGGEIEHFVDWLRPYIDAPDGEFLGYSRCEEDDHPTLIYK